MFVFLSETVSRVHKLLSNITFLKNKEYLIKKNCEWCNERGKRNQWIQIPEYVLRSCVT